MNALVCCCLCESSILSSKYILCPLSVRNVLFSFTSILIRANVFCCPYPSIYFFFVCVCLSSILPFSLLIMNSTVYAACIYIHTESQVAVSATEFIRPKCATRRMHVALPPLLFCVMISLSTTRTKNLRIEYVLLHDTVGGYIRCFVRTIAEVHLGFFVFFPFIHSLFFFVHASLKFGEGNTLH